VQLKPDVEAIFEFVGSRKDKLYEGYRPAHLIHENYLTSGVHSYYNLEADTDKDLRGTITFISPEAYPACLGIGKQITMYEGKTVVGHATNIFEPCRDEEYASIEEQYNFFEKWSTVREDFNVNRGSVGNNQQNGKN